MAAECEKEFFPAEGVKVALIHTAVHWKDKDKNVARLLELNEEAAREGARIIVNPELATSGYGFNGRDDIALLTETIPGPTTEALGQISKKHGAYICIGLPEVDAKTGIFYNAAAVIGPDGLVAGKYRKVAPAFKENLWSAEGNLPPLVIPTEYGNLGVVICADAYSYKPVRAAVLQGARLLLVPVNWPANYNNPEAYWRARAIENGVYVLVCNRTGMDLSMDCSSGESFIINNHGEVIKKMSSADDLIIYDVLPLENGKFVSTSAGILAQRRPQCYGNISLATFSHISSEFLLNLPAAGESTAAAFQYRPIAHRPELNKNKIFKLIDKHTNVNEESKPDLLVFPELSITGNVLTPKEAEQLSEKIPGKTTKAFIAKAKEKNVYIVIGMAEKQHEKFYNSSVLIGPGGLVGVYRKVHLTGNDKRWAQAGHNFPVFDLPFGRIGMLLGYDLMFPESTECLAKLGTDLLCAPCVGEEPQSRFIWISRVAEQMHLVIANQTGDARPHVAGGSAIYNYTLDPDQRQAVKSGQHESVSLRLNLKETRAKRFIEKVDYDFLLDLGDRYSDKSSATG